jgi:hypothetical protein
MLPWNTVVSKAFISVLILSFHESSEIDKVKTIEAHLNLYRSPDY